MIDSNIIFSAFYYPKSRIAYMINYIRSNYLLIISEYVIKDLLDAIEDKNPKDVPKIQEFIYTIADEIFTFDYTNDNKYPYIRDHDDIGVLANAIEAQVDILITGDTDFDDVKIDKPRIMKPRQFQDEYMNL